MGQGKLHVTKELMVELIGLQDGITIEDIRVNHFRGTIEVLLTGDVSLGLPDHIEGQEAITVDPEQVLRPRGDFNRVRWR
ncbi:hypothetical protein GZH47_32905 (plasmid) [Paenibacillus rhizovicinus]|uniref:Uncharacterized protein n=1 Tax=Paenibacillus rhizovicinus TaxID=2704463 RepID=A0A6C0PAU0_9BACL|nr:hypothetical protein [Paenibacillus rhizovicinus]QHW35694.1 hypothetical protein GZH47_32905 [Paenibacillus rhizovicinus]